MDKNQRKIATLLRQFLSTMLESHISRHEIFLSKENFNHQLEKERFRSNRSESAFALILFTVPENARDVETLKTLHKILNAHIRITDEIGWYDEDRIGVLVTDTDTKGAVRFLERLTSASPKLAGLNLDNAEILSYPKEERTIFKTEINRRGHDRIEMEATAQVGMPAADGGETCQTVSVQDISPGGVFLRTDTHLDIGKKIDVTLNLPMKIDGHFQGVNLVVRAQGKVVRREAEGVAVSFDKDYFMTCTLGGEEASV